MSTGKVESRASWLERKRAECWTLGVQHREALVQRYLEQEGLTERPLLKEIIDGLIEDVQKARLRDEVLPLDRFAQSEVRNGRVVVSINTRIAEMPKVRDAAGVAFVTKCHESLHIARDLGIGDAYRPELQPSLPGLVTELPRRIVCRSWDTPPSHWDSEEAAREFTAEAAGLAFAISGRDLVRCPAFRQVQRISARGGEVPWPLLYETAAFVGVNISALTNYFCQRGMLHIEQVAGKGRCFAMPALFGGLEWK